MVPATRSAPPLSPCGATFDLNAILPKARALPATASIEPKPAAPASRANALPALQVTAVSVPPDAPRAEGRQVVAGLDLAPGWKATVTDNRPASGLGRTPNTIARLDGAGGLFASATQTSTTQWRLGWQKTVDNGSVSAAVVLDRQGRAGAVEAVVKTRPQNGNFGTVTLAAGTSGLSLTVGATLTW